MSGDAIVWACCSCDSLNAGNAVACHMCGGAPPPTLEEKDNEAVVKPKRCVDSNIPLSIFTSRVRCPLCAEIRRKQKRRKAATETRPARRCKGCDVLLVGISIQRRRCVACAEIWKKIKDRERQRSRVLQRHDEQSVSLVFESKAIRAAATREAARVERIRIKVLYSKLNTEEEVYKSKPIAVSLAQAEVWAEDDLSLRPVVRGYSER